MAVTGEIGFSVASDISMIGTRGGSCSIAVTELSIVSVGTTTGSKTTVGAVRVKSNAIDSTDGVCLAAIGVAGFGDDL